MIYTVWQVFIGFLITFVLKRLLYVEFRVFWKEKKKGAGGVEDQDGLLPIFGSLLRQRMLVPCRDSGFSVAIGVNLRQEIPVATRHCVSRQCLCAQQ